MKNKIKQFNCLFGFLGITTCIYSTFIMPYLRLKGFSMIELGLFSSINISMSILGQLVFGYLCDAAKTIKKIFIANLLIIFFIALTMQINTSITIITVLIAGIGFFQGPLSVLSDSWVLGNESEVSQSFGSIRAWASIGWAACSVLMGTIIERFGWKSFFVSYMIMLLVTMAVTFRITDVYRDIKPKGKNRKVNPLLLFKDYRYVYVVLIMLLLTTTHQTISFLYVKITSLGGTSKHIGISAFVMAISELPVFFGAKYIIKRFRITSLFFFSASMYVIRMLLLGISNSYIQVIFLGSLQMITFSVYVITYKYFIAEIAPDELQVTAQSTASSVCAIGSIVFSSVAGYLIDKFSIDMLFRVGALTSFAGTLLILVYWLLIERKKLRTECVNYEEA
jgi:MFS transporter, PPP family, 3-phenylpropionic acid transporter